MSEDIYLNQLTKETDLLKELKSLKTLEKEHQQLVGKLYKEIDDLKKEWAIDKENAQAECIRQDQEIGRLMGKINERK
jgi:hypothetical protein